LARSWKQITKFKPSGAAPVPSTPARSADGKGNGVSLHPDRAAPVPIEAAAAELNLEGLLRDDRGIRMAPESDD
jgi:hypothetical protein